MICVLQFVVSFCKCDYMIYSDPAWNAHRGTGGWHQDPFTEDAILLGTFSSRWLVQDASTVYHPIYETFTSNMMDYYWSVDQMVSGMMKMSRRVCNQAISYMWSPIDTCLTIVKTVGMSQPGRTSRIRRFVHKKLSRCSSHVVQMFIVFPLFGQIAIIERYCTCRKASWAGASHAELEGKDVSFLRNCGAVVLHSFTFWTHCDFQLLRKVRRERRWGGASPAELEESSIGRCFVPRGNSGGVLNHAA